MSDLYDEIFTCDICEESATDVYYKQFYIRGIGNICICEACWKQESSHYNEE